MTDQQPTDSRTRIAFAMISGLLLLRLVMVLTSPLELYADEAQYWRWGTTLDWGYYSKPPMIAWVIHTSTAIFGDSEWAIRLFAPILHTVAALMLWRLSCQMFGSRAALITVAAYLLMPGVILSSTVISTDGVLFPFWCIALYLFWRLREGDLGWLGVIGLGAAIGLGFLSKYAMLYFGIGIALSMLIDAPTRKAVLSLKGAAMLAVAAAVLSPHLAWNAANAFQTVGHTVDNANLGGDLFNFDHLPKYLGDQMGVFGPVSFLALLAGLIFMRGDRSDAVAAKENWLACFIIPVLIIIAFQAVLSRAHANWAATAYPAASVLVASIFTRARANRNMWLAVAALTGLAILIAPALTVPIRAGIALAVAASLLAIGHVAKWKPVGLFWAGIGLHLSLVVFLAALLIGPQSWISATGMDNSFKRTSGWQDLADQLVLEAEQKSPSAILVDEREIWHGLDYYTRGRLDAPLILWRYNAGAENFAEQVPLSSDMDDNVLVASYRSNRRHRIAADFEHFVADGVIGVDLGHRSNGCPLTRELRLYRAHTYRPLTRDQAWIDRFKGQHMDRLPVCPAPTAGED